MNDDKKAFDAAADKIKHQNRCTALTYYVHYDVPDALHKYLYFKNVGDIAQRSADLGSRCQKQPRTKTD